MELGHLKRSTMSVIYEGCRGILVHIKETAMIVIRAGHLGILLGPIIVVGGPLLWLRVLSLRRWSKWLRWSLGRAGATFIKLGQWAATRPDLLPKDICEELAALHSNAPTHGMSWNEEAFLDSFGRPLRDVFEDFDPKPIGSGTIGQVHRARLRKGHHEVAVKITHPRIEKVIDRDLLLISWMARAFHCFIPALRWICLPEEVGCFSIMMREQLDLRFEAFTLNRFSQNFESTSKAWGYLPRIRFPRPIFPFHSRRCLVEELVSDALPVSTILSAAPQDSRVRRDVAVLGLRGFLQMLLWDNFVHADLHPGNILVSFLEDHSSCQGLQFDESNFGVELIGSFGRRVFNLWNSVAGLAHRLVTPGPLSSSGALRAIPRHPQESHVEYLNRQLDLASRTAVVVQVVFLDTGLVTELARSDFQNFTDLFKALVVYGDGYVAGELMIDRSPAWAQAAVVDREGFCSGLQELVAPIFGRFPHQTSLERLRLDVVLHRLFDLARKHHVRIESAYTNLVMSLLCVEGLGRQLAPETDLRPLLAQAALQYLIQSSVK